MVSERFGSLKPKKIIKTNGFSRFPSTQHRGQRASDGPSLDWTTSGPFSMRFQPFFFPQMFSIFWDLLQYRRNLRICQVLAPNIAET